MSRSKLYISSQVFCDSFLLSPFHLPYSWFTLKPSHVNITSPNSVVVKANCKATSGTWGFAQSFGASAQLVFLQDSSNVSLKPVQLQTTRDDFPVLGFQPFVLRGVWIDCSIQIHFLLGGWANFTLSRGLCSRKNLLRKLLMTNHKGHVAHQWFNFQDMLLKFQDYFA